MTKDEAYEKQRRERIALERENKKLQALIESYEKGSYTSSEKAEHLKQISKLDWENRQLRNKADDYKERWQIQLRVSDNMHAEAIKREMERDEARDEVNKLKKQCSKVEKQLTGANNLIKELQEELEFLKNEFLKEKAKSLNDGTNSGIPTSQTPYNKEKVIPNSRGKSGKLKGGQVGHEKHVMAPICEDQITEYEEHKLENCPKCFSDDLTLIEERNKDVLDYEIVIKRKRHVFYIYLCNNCGSTVHSPIPLHLKEKTQYGPKIQALGLAMTNTGFVSINRSKKMIDGMIGNDISISEGYLCKLQKRASKTLADFVEAVAQACINSKLLHWDDTVAFINKARACMRFYGNERLALYKAHLRKNREGIDEDGILAALSENTVVVHDHVILNYNDDFFYVNAECCQHLERDLQKLADISGHSWAKKMKELLQTTDHERKLLVESGITEFDSEKLTAFFDEVASLLEVAREEYKTASKYFDDEERRLISRLEEYHDAYFLWVLDFDVPPTNNLAERSLRGIKSKLKISGQFTSLDNARYFANIRTYTETCYRNGINTFEALVRLASGNPYTLSELLGEA